MSISSFRKVLVACVIVGAVLFSYKSFAAVPNQLAFEFVGTSSVSSDIAIVTKQTNKASWGELKYGISPDLLTSLAPKVELEAGASGSTIHHFVLENLQPNTTYYYQVTAERFEGWADEAEGPIISDIKSITTSDVPAITTITPTRGPVGTVVTITGAGFFEDHDPAYYERQVAFGCAVDMMRPLFTDCAGEIISWSDTLIQVRVSSDATSGPITISKFTNSLAQYKLFSISGPTFTLTEDQNSAVPEANASVVTEAGECTFSTTVSNATTVKVATLFKSGSATDMYVTQVAEAYLEHWSRNPRCDELQFHLDHSTPISRLIEWLEKNPQQLDKGTDYPVDANSNKSMQVPLMVKIWAGAIAAAVVLMFVFGSLLLI